MRASRFLVSFLVLVSSLVLAWWIIKNPNLNIKKIISSKNISADLLVQNLKELPKFQPLEKGLDLLKSSGEVMSKNLIKPITTGANLTQFLSQKAFESLVKNSSDGQIQTPTTEDVNNIIETAGADAVNNFNFSPIITGADIKIVDSSPLANKNYFNELKKISDTLFEGDKIQVYYDDFLNTLKDVPVPKSLSELHKQLLTMIITERNIFQAIQKYQEDPIKASLAIKKLPEVLDEIQVIIKVINKQIPIQ